MFNIRCASAVIFQLSLITYYVVSDSWTSLSYCQSIQHYRLNYVDFIGQNAVYILYRFCRTIRKNTAPVSWTKQL